MNFVSLKFVVFLLCLLLCYYVTPKKYRWSILLAGSYLFYLIGSARMTVFLLLTTVTTFLAGKRLGALNEETAAYLAANKTALDWEAKKQYKAQQTKRKRRLQRFSFGCFLFAAAWDFILYVSGSWLCDRCLPVQVSG